MPSSLPTAPRLPKKILFVGEGVALAHVSRPLVLAKAAQAEGFNVFFATSDPQTWVLSGATLVTRRLPSISPERFLAAVASGSPIYDFETLDRYVADDLELIRDIQPDLIVGDLRLSLAVSARIAEIPYAAIANAYWSPYSERSTNIMPPLSWTRHIPERLGNAAFGLIRPLAFAWHAVPLNRVRRKYGLAMGPFDVRNTYTDADHVLYADVPDVFPLRGPPPTHRFLGPIVWSPALTPPAWWDELTDDRPIIYVTLGSSGNAALLPVIIEALVPLRAWVVVASVGAPPQRSLASNVRIADFLPGDTIARRASLVVCNGGAPTCQQALQAGVPVLGITSNMDQLLNMEGVTAAGAGLLLRGERLVGRAVVLGATTILGEPSFVTAARSVARSYAEYPAEQRFRQLLNEVLYQER